MGQSKGNKTLIIVLLVILIAIMSVIGINIFLFRRKIKNYVAGHFEIRDGVETYVMSGQVVINSLVEVGDALYYVDDKGHKVKDTWAIIDNDGSYGYFGSLGDLVKDKIREIGGKKYYFDKNGILYTDSSNKEIITIDGTEYIANGNGELRLSTEPETTAAVTATTKAVQTQQQVAQTIPPTVAPTTVAKGLTPIYESQTAATTAAVISMNPPFANAINVAGSNTIVEAEGPGAGIITPTKAGTTAASGEVKVSKTEKVVDTIEGEEYDCTVTLLKPIMVGETPEETNALNTSIEELMDAWFDDVSGVVDEYVTFPKAVTFTSATLGTVKKKSIQINISGTIKPKSGSTKTIKYRITYDRENENADIVRTSTN